MKYQGLSAQQLGDLLTVCFNMSGKDRNITILVDVPDAKSPDCSDWRFRRQLALDWQRLIAQNFAGKKTGRLFYYPNVGANNGDLPETMYELCKSPAEFIAEGLHINNPVTATAEILTQAHIVLAMTQFSATAPLKVLAKKYLFRGATMPDFTEPMLPALALDYQKVNDRVMYIKERLDKAVAVTYRFTTPVGKFKFHADTRFRTAHASSGLMPKPGMVGNLPSGEAYIVPYEGEIERETSESQGIIPVQFEDEIVLYQIEKNRAVAVQSKGAHSQRERTMLQQEPAYGNISELGFGVLEAFGVKAVGSILLDEKLGVHIAFGRSEHFGGIISPDSFNRKKNVVHIDRVYIPECQPDIQIESVNLRYENDSTETVMRDNVYAF